MKFQRRSTIERGYEYYAEGRVSKLKPLTNVPGHQFSYSAEVRGNGGTSYHVEVTLDKQLSLIDGKCDCLAFESFDGPCKHIAAAAYYLGNHLGGGFGAPESAAKSLIKLEVGNSGEGSSEAGRFEAGRSRDEYKTPPQRTRATTSALLRCMEELEDEPVRLESERDDSGEPIRVVPSMIWENGQNRVELTLGRDRQYVVRSLKEFCRAFNDGEKLTFGKGLQFRAEVSVFDDGSKELIECLLRQYRQLYELRKAQEYYRPEDLADQLFTDKGRGMILTPQALDEFLTLMEGRTFEFDKRMRYLYGYQGRNHGGRSKIEEGFCVKVRVQEGEPVIPLELIIEPDGITLKAESLPFRCKGMSHLYVLVDKDSEILWKTSSEYKKKMGPFLDSLEQSEKEIFISSRDMTRFCVNVYGAIRGWLDIKGDVEYLESFMPWEMEGQLYLDSPDDGVITARAYGDYGVARVNLYNQKYYVGEATASAAGREASPSELEGSGLKRNEVQEVRLCHLLEKYFPEIDLTAGMLVIRDDDDAVYEFLKNGQAELANRVRMFVTERFKRLMFPAKNKMTAGVSIHGDLLNVTFDLEGFPPEELGDLLSSYRVKRRFHRLKSGTYLSLEDGEVRDAMELASGLQLTKEEMNAGAAELPRYRALYVDEVAKQSENLSLKRSESFNSLIRDIRDVDESKLTVPESLDNVLRDYQKAGYRWLKTMANLGFGGILADDMGLGKTLEVIAMLLSASEELREKKGASEDPWLRETAYSDDPDLLALVVCPASLVWNWAKELERFAPELRAVKVSGTAAERKHQIREASEAGTEERRKTVLITSYDLLKRDVELYESLYFYYHIVDEAQYIKNFATKNAKAVNALQSGHRFALTGTPIENRLSDLWSIFHFLMPGYLGSYMQFKNQYESPIVRKGDEDVSGLLQNQVRPFILRRLKQKVLKELPEKVESVVYVPMEGEQQKLYMANLAKIKLEVGETIAEGGFETNKLEILALLTRLRQLCCHPGLCYENYHGGSSKLDTCMELIREAVNGGHRILLFSQFTSMLSLIEERLNEEGIAYYLLTGQTPKSVRQHLVTKFNEGDVPVFLISLKAGGTGLNLTGADIVIHFDPWWNLAAQNQATDRAYRMGQRNSVQVYKLVADGTIEEKILKLQENKGNLADAFVAENNSVLGGLGESELRELLTE